MKNKNFIYIALGLAALYFFMKNKKKAPIIITPGVRPETPGEALPTGASPAPSDIVNPYGTSAGAPAQDDSGYLVPMGPGQPGLGIVTIY